MDFINAIFRIQTTSLQIIGLSVKRYCIIHAHMDYFEIT